MPHFLRFLLWVDYTTTYTLYYLFKRLLSYWNDRNLPAYLISKVHLTATIVLIPLDFFVLLTVGILTFRCFYHIIVTGMSQIESWEYERLESQLSSERLRNKIKHNYELLFGKELKDVTSWSSGANVLREPPETNIPFFTVDDLVFPYDLNPWSNLLQAFGYPWNWILPWGKPLGDGLSYPKNEYANPEDQDLSSLPWPPDGGHQDRINGEHLFNDTIQDNEQVVQRRMVHDPRNNMNRTEWYNDFGEKLSDFGVDVEAETFDTPSAAVGSSSEARE